MNNLLLFIYFANILRIHDINNDLKIKNKVIIILFYYHASLSNANKLIFIKQRNKL